MDIPIEGSIEYADHSIDTDTLFRVTWKLQLNFDNRSVYDDVSRTWCAKGFEVIHSPHIGVNASELLGQLTLTSEGKPRGTNLDSTAHHLLTLQFLTAKAGMSAVFLLFDLLDAAGAPFPTNAGDINVTKNASATFICFQPPSFRSDHLVKVRVTIFLKPIKKRGFAGLLQDNTFSDFCVIAGDLKIQAHKCILAERSAVFRKMLQAEMVESTMSQITITEFSPRIVKVMMTHLYDVNAEVELQDAMELIEIAHMYEIAYVKKEAEIILSAGLSLLNVIEAFEAAVLYDCYILKQTTIDFVKHNKSLLDSEIKKLGERNAEVSNTLMCEIGECDDK